MHRFLPHPAFVFGAFFGMAAMLFVVGMTSYQSDHCRQTNQSSETKPEQNKPTGSVQSEDQEREAEISEYAKGDSGACGIRGALTFSIGYMDHHEGFFVGLFTFVLALVTMLLWQSTNRLWLAGERQFEHIETNALAAKRAADAARDSLIAANRAWIKVRVFIEYQPIWVNEAEIYTGVSYYIENVGNAPATNVTIHPKLYVQESGINPSQRMREFCEDVRRSTKHAGISLFPGEYYPDSSKGVGSDSHGISAPMSECQSRSSDANGRKAVSLFVIGCIDYSFASDPNGRHQTGFIYHLDRTDLKPIFVDASYSLAASEIRMWPPPDIVDGRHAD